MSASPWLEGKGKRIMKKMSWQKIVGAVVGMAFGLWSAGAVYAQPDQNPAAPPAEEGAQQATTNAMAEAGADAPDATPDAENQDWRDHHNWRGSIPAVVEIGRNAELKSGEKAEAVVAILGSAIARGNVREAVVAVAGNTVVSGEVGDAVVAVFGDVTIEEGASVRGDVVSVGGDVTMAEGAKVRGDIVCVGGRANVAPGATVEGTIQPVPVPGLHALKDWIIHCVFKLRPLAPQVGWVWVVAGAFFLVYLLIAVATPRPVAACVRELTRRPATTFLMGLLTLLLVPVIILILAATGVGVFVIPFLMAAIFFGKLIGKVAFLEFLGESVVRAFSGSTQLKPLMALLLGSIIIAVIYLVPVLGLIAFMVTGTWALGAAVMGMFGGARRELPEGSASPSPATPVAPLAGSMAVGAAGFASAPNFPGTTQSAASAAGLGADAAAGNPAPAPTPIPRTTPAPAPEAFVYPRATFWERMGAAFLDIVLISILSSIVGGPPWGFLVALAYFAGMWAWKGTTVGGIVLNLKVVRLDDQPVTITVGLVRALAAAFSAVVFFLGFLWIAWDKEKQSWHDKIAGTVVVRLPRGMPLVCL
jgi:uncharacterized RDD family membrane protein YckC